MSGNNSGHGFGNRIASNSTTTLLGINETFTGTVINCFDYDSIRISISSDTNSSLNGIEIQFNDDSSNTVFDYYITDNYFTPEEYSRVFPIKGRYCRIKYENGSTAQTRFRLETSLKRNGDYVEENQMKFYKSIDNKSITSLVSDAIYTGTGEDVSKYSNIDLNIESDQTSATNGINVQFSSDNINWTTNNNIGTNTYSVSNSLYNKSYIVEKKYFRVVYTNGSSSQKKFLLTCLFHPRDKINEHKTQIIDFPDKNVDAFSRLRVSNVTTLAHFKNTQSTDQISKCEDITGTASKTHNISDSSVSLRVEAANSKIIRQSRRYITYQPGKSLLIFVTGVLDTGKYSLTVPVSGHNESDTISRIGYYDESNGYFFKYEANGSGTGNLYIVERLQNSITSVDNEIKQNCWNCDTMDCYGPSKLKLDPTTSQIFLIDMEWLGVGRVRVGCVMGGKIIYLHEFLHSNTKTTTYIGTATLPIRYELTSGSTGSNYNGTMREICGTVISEGGYTPLGNPFSISMIDHSDSPTSGTNNTAILSNQNEVPLIAIRLKHTNRRATSQFLGYSIVCTTNANILLRVRHYSEYSDETSNQTPMTKTAAWENVNADSYVEFDINDDNSGSSMEMSSANSRIVATSYISNNTDISINDVKREIYLTAGVEQSTSNNTKRDVVLLTAQNVGSSSNEKVSASIHWSEFD